MKTSFLMRLGSSALLLGVTAVGCTTTSRPSTASTDAVKGGRPGSRVARQAEAAIKAREVDKAVALAEQAVALSPRNGAYRAMLGQAYILAGRFTSAETSFGEALTLDPAQPRARFNMALAQIAQGNGESARATLAGLDDAVPQADIGLATVLSGDGANGIALLEQAVRAPGADAKARQNLALAYALSGRWSQAQTIAAQDVPADQLALRLAQWSQFARPRAPWEQVATLLNVTASVDTGRPEALALADPAPFTSPTAPQEALAAAEPAPIAQPAAPAEPVAMAAADAPEQAMPMPVVHREISTRAVFARAEAGFKHVSVEQPVSPAPRSVAGGKWVIQLGAFSQPRAVAAAWTRVATRVAGSANYAPAQSTYVKDGNQTLYRLTLAGFATRVEAQRMCGQIKTRGGSCFVRPSAGEQPIRMASLDNSRIAMN